MEKLLTKEEVIKKIGRSYIVDYKNNTIKENFGLGTSLEDSLFTLRSNHKNVFKYKESKLLKNKKKNTTLYNFLFSMSINEDIEKLSRELDQALQSIKIIYIPVDYKFIMSDEVYLSIFNKRVVLSKNLNYKTLKEDKTLIVSLCKEKL